MARSHNARRGTRRARLFHEGDPRKQQYRREKRARARQALREHRYDSAQLQTPTRYAKGYYW